MNDVNIRTRQSILELLEFFAGFGVPLTRAEILQYLWVKSTDVALAHHLAELMGEQKVVYIRKQYYGLAKLDYSNFTNQQESQTRLLKQAKKWVRLIGLIPMVKAVVVSDGVAWPSCGPRSNINLIVVTIPGRLYVSKALIHYLLNVFNLRALGSQQSGRIAVARFYTTAGFRFVEKNGPEPYRSLYFARCRALYGQKVWEHMLYKTPYLSSHLPNYFWKNRENQIFTPRVSWLEYFDDLGYRRQLKHVSRQKKYREEGAFLRVRPDVLIQAAGFGRQMQRFVKKHQQILRRLSEPVNLAPKTPDSLAAQPASSSSLSSTKGQKSQKNKMKQPKKGTSKPSKRTKNPSSKAKSKSGTKPKPPKKFKKSVKKH